MNKNYVPTDEEDVDELPEHLDVDWKFEKDFAIFQGEKYVID